jgi:hypothetical protein
MCVSEYMSCKLCMFFFLVVVVCFPMYKSIEKLAMRLMLIHMKGSFALSCYVHVYTGWRGDGDRGGG